MEVVVVGAARFPKVRPRPLGAWLGRLAAELAPEHDSLGVRLAGDRTMRALNRDFRGLDKTTDVLSFPGDDSPDGRHLGDIVISVPVAARQALERGHPLARELRLLLLHGVLHCLGHDHETDSGQMERLEAKLRRRWLSR